jgi:hypothetical protein
MIIFALPFIFVWTLKVTSPFLVVVNLSLLVTFLSSGVCMDIIFFLVREVGKFGKVDYGVDGTDFIHIARIIHDLL